MSDINYNCESAPGGYIRPIYGTFMETNNPTLYSHTVNPLSVNERIYATSGPNGDAYMQQFSTRVRANGGAWGNNADIYQDGQPWYAPNSYPTELSSPWNLTLIPISGTMEVEVYLAGDRPV